MDFVDRGPVGVHVTDLGKLKQFYDAIRSQGSAEHRQAALSNADARARSDRSLGHLAYRFWTQILSRVRWEYRYHCEPVRTAAHYSASDPKNAGRQADELVSGGYLCRVDLPRPSGGRPMPCYTIVCTAEDRSGETLEILKQEAKRRSITCDVQDDDPNRHRDDLQTFTMTGSAGSNPQQDDLQTLTMTGANPHHDAHTVDFTVDKDCRDSEYSPNSRSDVSLRLSLEEISEPKKARKNGTPTYTEAFKNFWRAYPDRRNNSKLKAFEEWRKLSAEDQANAQIALSGYMAFLNANPKLGCLHAERYLRHRRFDGYLESETLQKNIEPFWKDPDKLKALIPERWRDKIEKFAGNFWDVSQLGPPPGDRSCVVPVQIIEELRLVERYDKDGIQRRSWVEESEHDRQLRIIRQDRERERKEREMRQLNAIVRGGR